MKQGQLTKDWVAFAALLAAVMFKPGLADAADAALYVGYYQEDPTDNPEDPTIGSLYLKLPDTGGDFAGNMFFTYIGCQTSNVGTITGKLAGDELQGTWTGTTDGTAQHGNFSGRRAKARDAYAGTYTVAGGKQHIVVANCIDYYVASKGSFELLAAGKSDPASFAVSERDKSVSWTATSGAVMTLVSVLDPEIASAGQGNATLWQMLLIGDRHSADFNDVKLKKGHRYLTTVSAVDQSFKRISVGSVEFLAQ